MNFCTKCGAARSADDVFCASCGQPVDAVAPTPTSPAATPVEASTPAPPTIPAATPAPAAAPVDFGSLFARVLTGNWVGGAIVAFATLASSLILGVLLAALSQDRGTAGSAIWGGFGYGLAALGVPLHIDEGADSASTFAMPLTLTFVVFGFAAIVFGRMTRGYPRRTNVLGDALRAAVVLAVLTTIFGVVLKIVNPTISGFGERGGTAGDALWLLRGERAHMTPSVAGSIFIPAIVLAVVLVLVGGAGAYRQSDATDKVHLMALPTLAGLRSILFALPLIGLIPVVSAATRQDANNGFRFWVDRVSALPNVGVHAVGEGLGGKFGFTTSGPDQTLRLSGIADELNWVVWLVLPAAIVVVIVSAAAAARRSTQQTALWTVAIYTTSLLVLMPLLALVSSSRVSGKDSDNASQFARIGVDSTALTFTFWGASIVALTLCLVLAGKLRVNHLQQTPPPPTD